MTAAADFECLLEQWRTIEGIVATRKPPVIVKVTRTGGPVARRLGVATREAQEAASVIAIPAALRARERLGGRAARSGELRHPPPRRRSCPPAPRLTGGAGRLAPDVLTPSEHMSMGVGVVLLCLAIAHLLAARLRFLPVIPRSSWLSLAGGVSVAYVFVHLLPELADAQQEHGARLPIPHGVYLIALFGLTAFYGLERLAAREPRRGEAPRASARLFWLHLGSFGLYNAIIAYVLVADPTVHDGGIALYGVAMGLHFVVNDYGLWTRHRERYDGHGRWALAAAILVGGALGAAIAIPRSVIAALVALLAGGVVMNVLKEELPEERESQFVPFLVGASVFAVIALVV